MRKPTKFEHRSSPSLPKIIYCEQVAAVNLIEGELNENHTQTKHKYTAIYSHVQPYTTIYGHIQPYTAIYSHIRPYTAIYSHIQPSTAIYGHIQPFTAIYSHIRPYTAICCCCFLLLLLLMLPPATAVCYCCSCCRLLLLYRLCRRGCVNWVQKSTKNRRQIGPKSGQNRPQIEQKLILNGTPARASIFHDFRLHFCPLFGTNLASESTPKRLRKHIQNQIQKMHRKSKPVRRFGHPFWSYF